MSPFVNQWDAPRPFNGSRRVRIAPARREPYVSLGYRARYAASSCLRMSAMIWARVSLRDMVSPMGSDAEGEDCERANERGDTEQGEIDHAATME